MCGIRLRAFLLLGPLALLPAFSDVAAQGKGKIEGYVLDSQHNEALPGANVLIEGTSYGAATDLKGKFVILQAPAGNHRLAVSYIGYRKKTVAITVTDGQTSRVEVKLDFQVIEGEVVTVTAQAEGQMEAINQQFRSNTVTNIVSEARIKELPDVNAAESIGRLPGVAIKRSGGEATKVSIRGLSPKYNTVTVNGVRVPSTDGNDRSVDLSLISSNMLDGIEVKKAITPDMDADAIGGSVDLRLKEAPKRWAFDVTAQGGYNRLQDYYGNYNFNANVSNRFLSDRLGVIASLNADHYDRSADKFSAEYRRSTSTLTGEPIIVVSSVGLREETVQRRRMGGSLVLDYRIPVGKVSMNGFYNRLHSDGLYRINDINANVNRHYYDLERHTGNTSIFTGALSVEQNFDWLRYDAGLALTASRAENPEDYFWRFGQEGNVFTGLPNENTHPSELQSMIRVDSLTALQEIRVTATNREENVTTGQLNLQMPFRLGGWIDGYLKTGGKLSWLDRRNDEFRRGRQGMQYGSGAGNLNDPFDQIAAQLPGWGLEAVIGNLGILPIGLVLDDYKRNDFLIDATGGPFDLGFVANESQMLSLTSALQSTLGVYGEDASEYRISSIGTLGRDYDGEERYQAGYVMAELNLGQYITLIPGIRYENDYSQYNGQRYREIVTAWRDQAPADFERLTNTRENSFWLPMVHLQAKPAEWVKIRLAYTETLSRPDYIQYTPITTIDGFRSNINAANGLLKPAQSANYDAAVSVYENKIGLFTVAGFYKSIDDLIIPVNFNVNPLFLTSSLPPGLNVPTSWYRDVAPTLRTNINNPFDATYKGFELDWQTNFWYLPSVLKGIVLSANYTYIKSETEYQGYFLTNSDSIRTQRPRTYWQILRTDSTRIGRMLDQPSHIANLTLGYDYKGFSTRFSFLYQTDISTYIDPTNPLFDTFSDDYARFDVAVKQRLANAIEIFANFSNLNNRADENYRGGSTFNPSYIEYYGFTMDLGFRYRF
ncbi:MAG: TonB-dependent receptor [bacterium]